jgi:hypothetical protein
MGEEVNGTNAMAKHQIPINVFYRRIKKEKDLSFLIRNFNTDDQGSLVCSAWQEADRCFSSKKQQEQDSIPMTRVEIHSTGPKPDSSYIIYHLIDLSSMFLRSKRGLN